MLTLMSTYLWLCKTLHPNPSPPPHIVLISYLCAKIPFSAMVRTIFTMDSLSTSRFFLHPSPSPLLPPPLTLSLSHTSVQRFHSQPWCVRSSQWTASGRHASSFTPVPPPSFPPPSHCPYLIPLCKDSILSHGAYDLHNGQPQYVTLLPSPQSLPPPSPPPHIVLISYLCAKIPFSAMVRTIFTMDSLSTSRFFLHPSPSPLLPPPLTLSLSHTSVQRFHSQPWCVRSSQWTASVRHASSFTPVPPPSFPPPLTLSLSHTSVQRFHSQPWCVRSSQWTASGRHASSFTPVPPPSFPPPSHCPYLIPLCKDSILSHGAYDLHNGQPQYVTLLPSPQSLPPPSPPPHIVLISYLCAKIPFSAMVRTIFTMDSLRTSRFFLHPSPSPLLPPPLTLSLSHTSVQRFHSQPWCVRSSQWTASVRHASSFTPVPPPSFPPPHIVLISYLCAKIPFSAMVRTIFTMDSLSTSRFFLHPSPSPLLPPPPHIVLISYLCAKIPFSAMVRTIFTMDSLSTSRFFLHPSPSPLLPPPLTLSLSHTSVQRFHSQPWCVRSSQWTASVRHASSFTPVPPPSFPPPSHCPYLIPLCKDSILSHGAYDLHNGQPQYVTLLPSPQSLPPPSPPLTLSLSHTSVQRFHSQPWCVRSSQWTASVRHASSFTPVPPPSFPPPHIVLISYLCAKIPFSAMVRTIFTMDSLSTSRFFLHPSPSPLLPPPLTLSLSHTSVQRFHSQPWCVRSSQWTASVRHASSFTPVPPPSFPPPSHCPYLIPLCKDSILSHGAYDLHNGQPQYITLLPPSQVLLLPVDGFLDQRHQLFY